MQTISLWSLVLVALIVLVTILMTTLVVYVGYMMGRKTKTDTPFVPDPLPFPKPEDKFVFEDGEDIFEEAALKTGDFIISTDRVETTGGAP